MRRRDAVRTLAAVAALPFVPRTGREAAAFGAAVHGRVSQGAGFRTLTAGQQALVGALSDRILPATETPGALDVRVPEFIDLLLTEWFEDADRDRLLSGLAAIDERARAVGGVVFAELQDAGAVELMRALDGERDERATPASRAFGELKSLVVYGYFTSEQVSKDVLHTQIYFSAYDGCAPVES